MIFRTLLCLALLFAASAQVIGIDFGTEYWKSAIISPGKSFVIVENSKSERKTHNAIAFIDGVRIFESDASSKKARFPKRTFTDLNTLIPLLDDPTRKVEFDIPYKLKEGTIVLELPDEETATIEQVIAMILKNIKEHASKQAGTEIRDCALTVPSDWGLAARTALVNAAYIADLAVLSVINDNTAAALNYAMSRNDNGSINVIIYNLGSHKLQVSIVRFFGYNNTETNKTIESIDILAHASSTEFAGYEMDNRIAQILAKKFKAKTGVDVAENQRSWGKLMQKASDVKETLSANKEVHVYIESLINGIDLNIIITRAEVEEPIDFSVLLKPVIQALDAAQLTKDQIHSVELIGGASRIPRVISTISQFFNPVEVGTHINSDEAIAIGSVFHAANMSSAFRVKDIHVYDRLNLSIGVDIKDAEDNSLFSEEVFFKADDPVLLRRQILIENPTSELTIDVKHEGEIVKQFKSTNLAGWKDKYDNGNLTKPAALKILTVLSPVAIFDIKDSFLTITRNESTTKQVVDYVKEKIIYPDEEKAEATETKTEDKNEQKQEEKESDKEAETSEQNVEKETSTEGEAEKTEQTKTEQANAEQAKTESGQGNNNETQNKTETKKKPKRPKFKTVTVRNNVTKIEEKTIKLNIKFDAGLQKYKRFSKVDININKILLQKFEGREKLIKETAQAKNDLESRIYDIRRDFEKDYMSKFGKENEIENLKKVVEEELAWLEQNSYTAKKNDFVEHLNILFSAFSPIYNRTVEYQNRPETFNKTVEYLGLVYDKTSELNNTHPWLRKKVQKLLDKVNDTMLWYSEKLKQQETLPLNENPVVYNAEPIRRAEKLRDQYYALKLIPRPKKKQNKAEEEEAKSENPSADEQKTEKGESQAKEQQAEKSQKAEGQTEL